MTARVQSSAVRRLVVITIAALTVAAGAIAVSGGDENVPAVAASPPVTAALYAGLAQSGISIGDPHAPATMVEFADLQCPYCGVYGRDVLPAVIERYVRTGRLRLQLHVLTFLGGDSVRAGRLAAAAAQQDKLWSFVDAFYARQGEENSGYVTDAFLSSTARAAGLDVDGAVRGRDDSVVTRTLARARAEADRLEVESTPSFFVRRGRGRLRPLVPNDLRAAEFTAALDAALDGR